MFCNGSATLYHKTASGYEKRFFPRVFWSDSAASVDEKSGRKNTKGVILRIPTAVNIPVTDDDFFVKGSGPAIDNTSEQTISESIKVLKPIYSVAGWAPKLYGSAAMHHYEFTLR